MKVDVVIIGGGIAGASLGAALAPHAQVVVCEAEEICGHHATGRSAAFWHEGYGGALVAPLTRLSRPVLETGGFLTPRGAIHLARDDQAFDIVPGVSTEPLSRPQLEQSLPGLRPAWTRGLAEAGLADIDVAGLHAKLLAQVRRNGAVREDAELVEGQRGADGWALRFRRGEEVRADVLVNAAGAWADMVAIRCAVQPLGVVPKRRTMVQLRVGRDGLSRLPLVIGAAGDFYFKGAGERTIWLSPHDEIVSEPCDAAPEEIDIATAIDRLEQVVDWPIERVERSWAGLRTFAPDRLPVFGFDPRQAGFFWCAGQGGFGIQTAPAAAMLCAGLIQEQPGLDLDPAPFDPARFGV
jgi:D-arginine dehydrogenase